MMGDCCLWVGDGHLRWGMVVCGRGWLWWRVIICGGGWSFTVGDCCLWMGVVVCGHLGVWGYRLCGAWSSVEGHCHLSVEVFTLLC